MIIPESERSDVASAVRLRPTRVTFVLPSRNRSGGVRVTVEMANRLLAAGYSVRIAWRKDAIGILHRMTRFAKLAAKRMRGVIHDDWLQEFRGPAESFTSLRELDFERDEVVVAVGSKTVRDVYELNAPVARVRYCHGFHRFLPEQMKAAWGMPMPTLTVAETLVPDLQRANDGQPIWVVPNGISFEDYYDQRLARNGIGTIFSRNIAKSPEDVLEVMGSVPQRWPGAKRYVFGEPRRPAGISSDSYWRYPPLARARELYNRSKVWLLLSRDEGLPGPILEAMACGCAVISTDNDGGRELVRDGENGLLIPTGDTKACLEAIDRLWKDHALRHCLVQNGLATARAFSWENAVRKMQTCLEEIVKHEGLGGA